MYCPPVLFILGSSETCPVLLQTELFANVMKNHGLLCRWPAAEKDRCLLEWASLWGWFSSSSSVPWFWALCFGWDGGNGKRKFLLLLYQLRPWPTFDVYCGGIITDKTNNFSVFWLFTTRRILSSVREITTRELNRHLFARNQRGFHKPASAKGSAVSWKTPVQRRPPSMLGQVNDSAWESEYTNQRGQSIYKNRTLTHYLQQPVQETNPLSPVTSSGSQLP